MIGVYVCHCGINIAATVDVEAVTEYAGSLENVAVARHYQYMCSDPGQELIRRDIKELGLDAVVVASCSPRMHERTFRKACEDAELNPYCFEMANIREQCSWIHSDKDDATEKAKDLVGISVAKARLSEPLERATFDVTHSALVIGGGIAGIQASLDIAEGGFDVYLVEREPSIGGHMAQLDKTFPTLDCSACILTPKMVEVAQNPRIKLLTYSEVEEVGGYVGNFRVKVRRKPRYIDEDKCTGCGLCADSCRLKGRIPNEFDVGMGKRSASYIPFPYAVPAVYTIDPERCLMITKGKCGKMAPCLDACGPGAIDFDQKEEDIEIDVGAIIVAIGYDLIDASLKGEYKYGIYDNVITGLELERLCSASGPTGGEIIINGKKPKDVVFIQCVGSRDDKLNPYCSRVCCMYTAKHTHLIKEKIPNVHVTVFYMDIRAFGKGFEEFHDRVREEGVVYRRGGVSDVFSIGDKLIARAEDTLLGEIIEVPADLVVLATGIVPGNDTKEVARVLKISEGMDGFMLEAHPKLRPMDTASDGIFLAGCCQGPKDIPDTVAQASGAAARAITVISKDKLEAEGIIAVVNDEICSGCRICERICAYGAIEITEGVKGKAEVNNVLCKGCGACSAACPSGAMGQNGFMGDQVFAMIDAATGV